MHRRPRVSWQGSGCSKRGHFPGCWVGSSSPSLPTGHCQGNLALCRCRETVFNPAFHSGPAPWQGGDIRHPATMLPDSRNLSRRHPGVPPGRTLPCTLLMLFILPTPQGRARARLAPEGMLGGENSCGQGAGTSPRWSRAWRGSRGDTKGFFPPSCKIFPSRARQRGAVRGAGKGFGELPCPSCHVPHRSCRVTATGHRAAIGERGTGRMGPQRPPALRGCASRAPPNLLRILCDMAMGVQRCPSASGQDPDPHPAHGASLLGWHGQCSGKG